MNENCTDASECYALNAQCDNMQSSDGSSQCNCNGMYNIVFNSYLDNPACLKHEEVGEFCNLDSECYVSGQDYDCVKEDVSNSQLSKCKCMGYYTLDKNEQIVCLYIPDPLELSVGATPCTAEDFVDESSCQMICRVELNKRQNLTLYNLVSCSWNYYIDGYWSSPNVKFFNIYECIEDIDIYSTYLTLSSYNAGRYLCSFVISYDNSQGNFYGPFITIDDSVTPVNLSDSCNASTECLALNSVCNTTCQCPANYNVTDNTADGVLACLAPEDYYKQCNIDAECEEMMAFTMCENNKCVCQQGFEYRGSSPDDYCAIIGVLAGECNVYDFDNSSCTTWCAYDITIDPVYSYEWSYGDYIFSSDDDYIFSSDDVTAETSKHFLNISMTLTEYYSGYYECSFYLDEYYDNRAYYYYMISNTNGEYMGGPCEDKSSCLALNAECGSLSEGAPTVCTCTGNNSVELYDGYSDNIACLPPSGHGEPCQYDCQCRQDIYNSYCTGGLCQCLYDYSGPQCTTAPPVDYGDVGLSVGAVVGIVIGSFVGCAIVIGIIVYIVKKK